MWTSNTLESGLERFNEGDIFQLQVLPKFNAKRFGQINFSLKRQDGQTFVLILKAGATMYPASLGPISDPFFSARTIQSKSNPSDGRLFYFPDRGRLQL
jgi:hypothetical protein